MSNAFGGDSGFHSTPGEGQQVALTEEEQKQVAKLLGDPTYFPIEFRRWLKDYIENSGIKITSAQIVGGGTAGSGDPVGLPPGMILPFAGSKFGNDCLPCNGAAISRTDYPELFDAIGTTWGNGDGSTTFNVPDLRDRALYGKGTVINIGSTDGKGASSRGGPSHSHSISGSTGSGGSHSHSVSGNTDSPGNHGHSYDRTRPDWYNSGQQSLIYQATGNFDQANTGSAGAHTHSVSGSTNTVGGHTHSIGGNTSGDSGNVDKPSYAGVQYVITLGRSATS